MKRLNLIIFLFISVFCFSQDDSIDSLTIKMCSNFRENIHLKDSVRIIILNEKFITPYLNKFPKKEQKTVINNLYFRFQKNCKEFREFLHRVNPPKNDNWKRLDSKPEISVTDDEISLFKKTNDFYYFEAGGAKTVVKINNNFWTETFADKTKSKLYFNWVGRNQFELEFIESNNLGRKNFSKPGDKYLYEIVSKEDNYYWILVEIPGQSELLKFKLF